MNIQYKKEYWSVFLVNLAITNETKKISRVSNVGLSEHRSHQITTIKKEKIELTIKTNLITLPCYFPKYHEIAIKTG